MYCKHYKQITFDPQYKPTHIKYDTWYKVDNDSRAMFIEDLYAAYINLCNVKKIPSVTLDSFKQEYPGLKRAECFRINSEIVTVNYRTNYNDKYMRDTIDYKQLIKEINEKTARKIMNNSDFGKTPRKIIVNDASYSDQICTEPNIIEQYYNKKQATYERERDDAIRKLNEASPVGKAITNFIAALKKAGLKDEKLPNFNMLWNENCLTDAEKAAIKEVDTAYQITMTKLHDNCKQCEAILADCETFEQKMTVLQKYDIVDSDYKLKV